MPRGSLPIAAHLGRRAALVETGLYLVRNDPCECCGSGIWLLEYVIGDPPPPFPGAADIEERLAQVREYRADAYTGFRWVDVIPVRCLVTGNIGLEWREHDLQRCERARARRRAVELTKGDAGWA